MKHPFQNDHQLRALHFLPHYMDDQTPPVLDRQQQHQDGLANAVPAMDRASPAELEDELHFELRKLGCERVEKRNGMVRYWYKPPKKTAKSNAPPQATSTPQAPLAPESGGDDAIPF